ncbi:MAG: pilus assembly protein [Nocardioides sp.]|nr:pilus assembly protein [Nocardioides sp.]
MRFRGQRGQHGAAAVEFALVMIPFFVLVLGLIEYGWYFYVAQNTSGAASTLARKLEVGDCWSTPLSFAQNQSSQVTAVSLNPSQGSSPAVGTTFTVTVTADAKIMSFLPVPDDGVVSRQVTAQIEDDQASTC